MRSRAKSHPSDDLGKGKWLVKEDDIFKKGKRMHVADWARELGIKPGTISSQLHRGHAVADALHQGSHQGQRIVK